MSLESARLLATTWSWIDAVLGVVLLGVMTPLAVAVLVASILLGVQRRDWRLVPGAAGVVVLLLLAGLFAIAVVLAPAPPRDYLLALSASLGGLVLFFSTVAVVRQSMRRRGQDRVLQGVVETQPFEEREAVVAQPTRRRSLNAVNAEHYVAEWMQHLGATDSVVTPFRRDGGIDVRSSRYVAQVKHRADLVPVEQVRALVGVASTEGRQALFFTSGAYSRDSISFAATARVALFIFRPKEGRLVAANALAAGLRQSGLTVAPDGRSFSELEESGVRPLAVRT